MRENRCDRRPLLFDVSAELTIDVRNEGGAYILQLRLLRCRMCVVECAQPDTPSVHDKLVSLRLVQFGEEREAIRPPVSDVRRDLVRRVDNGCAELLWGL